MGSIRRLAVAASAASIGFVAFGLARGAWATTGALRPNAAIPADCTVTNTLSAGSSLTCTGRPANQTWYLFALCYEGAGKYSGRTGNAVTGDGKSTISFCAGATDEQFET